MSWYADTSALVKLFLAEPETPRVRAAADADPGIITSLITYAECLSAMRRAVNRGDLTPDLAILASDAMDNLWPRLSTVPLAEPARIRGLIERHNLRAGDAIQLAAALEYRDAVGPLGCFACFDGALCSAAVSEGLTLIP